MRYPIHWPSKLKYLLETWLFCLAIAALQYMFHPEVGWAVPLVYSLCIGSCTWALIDFGRHAFASSSITGWPRGAMALGLPLGGMALGYVLGMVLADRWFGWSSWGQVNRFSLPLSIAISMVSSTVISYYFFARNKALSLERGVAEARQQASEARLRLLESQLEPHMLFNTLANLRALIGTDPARAQAMLDHLNAYLRATLSASRSDAATHSLAQEFARLQDYLALMAIRMGPRLQFSLQLPEALRALAVPPLLLQPLVENSIRHGLEPKLEGGSIHITVRQDGACVQIEVRDTGLGCDDSAATQAGFGLAHVRERLATRYGTHASLALRTPPGGGTLALITLPLPT